MSSQIFYRQHNYCKVHAHTFKRGFNVLQSLHVCVSCVCIDWPMERQVSVVIISGFFSRACRMQTFILGFSDWFLNLILGNFVLRVAAFVPSMIVRRFWTAVSSL